MIQTLAELSEILRSTILKDSNIASLEIPKSQQLAFAIEVLPSQMLDCWHLLRLLVNDTEMYPVLSNCWLAGTGNWQQNMDRQNFFIRSEYIYEQQNSSIENIAPKSIIDAAKSINGEKVIKRRIKEYDREDNQEWWESKLYLQDLEVTEKDYGIAPKLREAEAALNFEEIITDIDFERWLLTWESKNVPKEQLLAPPNLAYQDWYDINPNYTMPLLLLPTLNSWETLAYIHFFGATNSAEDIAILKYWYDRYGAELVAHYGTMLQFCVRNKPQTLMEAYELAAQHYEFAPCTLILPGVSIREHARALLHIERWFLHERP